MCAGHDHSTRPNIKDILDNLRKPAPLGQKLRMIAANTLRKLVRRQSCCGNDGQPGC